MIKITDLDKSIISVEKAVGKPLAFKLGEIVKAEVIDVFADGGVSLKIKGSYLTAKTEVPLLKDSTVLFKVLGSTGSDATGKDLKLQFKGYTDPSEVTSSQSAAKLLQIETVTSLMRDLSQIMSTSDKATKDFPVLAEQLMKALPAESEALPKELRIELQDLLKAILSTTGKDLRGRIETLAQQLESQLKESAMPEGFARSLMISVQKLTPSTLKNALENTGVVLEARLKAILINQLSQEVGADRKPGVEALARESAKVSVEISEQAAVAKSDLKAGLVHLKTLLTEKGGEILKEGTSSSPDAVSGRTGSHESLPAGQLLKAVDSLLRDIDTFQLLSKTTDSFYTFLPVLWKEMREGDIAFKRSQTAGGGRSYYCMMNLDFESMGNLGIMIMMQDQEFFASFKAGDPGLKSILEEHAQELRKIFEENGMSLKAVNVLGSEDTSLAPFERLENLESILNIRV